MTATCPEPYYADDLITLFRGDCLELWQWIVERCQVLVTDPPYGIAYRRLHEALGKHSIANDHDTSVRDEVLRRWAHRGPALVFGSWKRPRPERVSQLLIWEKGLNVGMGNLRIPWKPNHEEIYVIGKGDGFTGRRTSGVLHFSYEGVGAAKMHPTVKPLALMRELLVKTLGVVLDPFAGSGSTLVAAKQLGRRAIGIELDPAHCETAAARLRDTKVLPR